MKDGQSAAKLLNEKYKGKHYGILTVLEFSHKVNNKYFYKCLCNRCNTITTARLGRGDYTPKSCHNCVNDLQKEIADEKYLAFRKYKNIYNAYKSGAKSRNFEFNLILEDIIKLVNSNCYYCGDENSKGIDRIDSNDNYYLENVVPCCRICNFMKNNFSIEEFFNKIKLIYELHLKESSTTIPNGSTLK
jgi:hypothetical protein